MPIQPLDDRTPQVDVHALVASEVERLLASCARHLVRAHRHRATLKRIG
ncbi:MAG TPA: hypothetical protein VMU33_06440 [Burkholderiaceae bacterium]|nr:hypothetical protein [Burkholderiaceae bacterium]